MVLRPVLRQLKPRDQRLLRLRFHDDLTQQEIADDFGVTQTQVSRLLLRVLRDLREALDDPAEPEGRAGGEQRASGEAVVGAPAVVGAGHRSIPSGVLSTVPRMSVRCQPDTSATVL